MASHGHRSHKYFVISVCICVYLWRTLFPDCVAGNRNGVRFEVRLLFELRATVLSHEIAGHIAEPVVECGLRLPGFRPRGTLGLLAAQTSDR
jgi:hypothetical protein